MKLERVRRRVLEVVWFVVVCWVIKVENIIFFYLVFREDLFFFQNKGFFFFGVKGSSGFSFCEFF